MGGARAPRVALLDVDYLFRPSYLETMGAARDADPGACIATCNARVFGAVSSEDEVVGEGQTHEPMGSLLALLSGRAANPAVRDSRSEEHTSELQSLRRIQCADCRLRSKVHYHQ